MHGKSIFLIGILTILIAVGVGLYSYSQVIGNTFFNTTITSNPNLEDGLIAHWTLDGDSIDYTAASEVLERVGGLNGNMRRTPVVQTVAEYNNPTPSDTAAITMPSGVTAGDLLITKLCWSNGTSGWTDATATGWTKLDSTNNTTAAGGGVWYRFADGGEGATQTFTKTNADSAVTAITLRISGAGTPEISNAVLGNDANPDATTTAPSGVPNDYLWVVEALTNGDNVFTANPTGYTEQGQVNSGDDECTSYTASKSTTAATTEDPGSATFADTWHWIAWTVAVPPPAVIQTPGKIGQAMQFDGTSNYIEMPNESYFDFTGNQPFSVAFWFKTADPGSQWATWIGKGDSAWTISQNNTTNEMLISVLSNSGSNYDTLESSGTVDDNEWHHAVYVYDGGTTGTLYLDGAFDAQNTSHVTGTLTPNNFPVTIGYDSEQGSGTEYSGLMDDIRIYDRALTSEDVERLYGLGATTHINTTIETNENLENGLVGHWTFDGKDMDFAQATAEVRGSVGAINGNTINFGSEAAVSGQIGQGLLFNGSDNYVDMGDVLDLTGDFTLVAWVKRAGDTVSGSAGTIFGKEQQSDSQFTFEIVDSDHTSDQNKVRLITFGHADNSFSSTATVTNNEWHHIIAILSGTTKSIYVDGVFSGSESTTGSLSANSDSLRIGHSRGTFDAQNFFNGVLDDIRIYNRALSLSEVTRLYELGATTHINTSINTNDDLDNGLAVHLTFDGKHVDFAQATAEMRDRISTNHGNAINMDASNATPGKIGQAFVYNGTDEFVSIGPPSLTIANGYTLSAWVNANVAPDFYQIITVDETNATADRVFQFRVNGTGGGIQLLRGNSSNSIIETVSSSGVDITDGEWHLVTATFNTTVGTRLYIDGVQRGSSSNVTANRNIGGAEPILVGARRDSVPANFWSGKIDDVRVYTRSLSASEVLRLYQLGK